MNTTDQFSSAAEIDESRIADRFLRVQRMENIGLLAAGIAHDLNNVLVPILMAAPVLRDQATDPGARQMLETMLKSAQRGASLVRQMLLFTQGAGDERQLMQVQTLLHDITGVISDTFPRDIRVELLAPQAAWSIRANPTQIYQVLLNLCINARDAMPHGGLLRLGAENCQLTAPVAAGIPGARAGRFLVLSVADTGTGIPPEVLERMWQPFFTTKDAGKGTGLGLSTVRGILEKHHGFVEVKTEVGRGTCFRAFFPMFEPGDAAPALVEPPAAPEKIASPLRRHPTPTAA